jgi:hypothetical protein
LPDLNQKERKTNHSVKNIQFKIKFIDIEIRSSRGPIERAAHDDTAIQNNKFVVHVPIRRVQLDRNT